MKIFKNKYFFLFSLFLFSFFIRACFCIYFVNKNNNHLVCTDSSEYMAIAENWYKNYQIKKSDGDYNFRRLPGYPVFIATCYRILGEININKALWIQILLSCFIPILVFYLSLNLFAQNFLLAKIVSIISAVHLGFVLHSGLVLSETLFLILFLIFLILFYKSIQTGSYFVYSGLFLGFISLIRPVGHYLIILSLIIIFLSKFNLKNKLKNFCMLFIGWFLIVFIWILRNYLLTGYIFFHTLPGIHFLIYTAAYIDSDVNKTEYCFAKEKLLNKWDKSIKEKELNLDKKLSDIEFCILAENIAFDYIKSNKILFLKHSFIHMLKTCFTLNSTNILFWDQGLPSYDKNTNLIMKIKRFLFPETQNRLIIFLIYFEMFLLLITYLGFIGFIFFIKDFIFLFKILSVIFLFIFLTLAYGCARLRLPIEPILLICSTKFWLDLFFYKKIGKELYE